MKNQDSNSDATTSLLVELLRPLVKQALNEAVIELSEQVKSRPPKPFNVREASEYLDIPVSSLYQLTSKKLIPFHKRGRKLFFYQDELDNWVKKEER